MESQPNSVPEKELVERVMELHRKGLGVRRISKTLKLEGNPRSKDQVWRIIKKHAHEASSETDVDQSKGFKHLKQKEKQLQKLFVRVLLLFGLYCPLPMPRCPHVLHW